MTEDPVDRIVAQWHRERPDLDASPMAVFGRIYRIARLMADRVAEIYQRYGIGRGEFDVLATLRRAGAPYTLSPKAMTATLMLTSGGMTGRLDRLERAGLIARTPIRTTAAPFGSASRKPGSGPSRRPSSRGWRLSTRRWPSWRRGTVSGWRICSGTCSAPWSSRIRCGRDKSARARGRGRRTWSWSGRTRAGRGQTSRSRVSRTAK
nr:hypothetical protein GCM10020093_105720 [Planobispora longispora]